MTDEEDSGSQTEYAIAEAETCGYLADRHRLRSGDREKQRYRVVISTEEFCAQAACERDPPPLPRAIIADGFPVSGYCLLLAADFPSDGLTDFLRCRISAQVGGLRTCAG